jgi:hypothetical protein
MIEMLDEAVRHRISECTEEVAKDFRLSVRPIYGSDDGILTTPIGSCLLLIVDEVKYVATAAHIVDEITTHSLHVAGPVGGQLVQIVGEINSTRAPPGGRRKDRWDFAFWPIPPEADAALGTVRYLDANDASHNRVPTANRLYLAMGYPVSRNKKGVNKALRKIKTVVRKYSGKVLQLPALAAELGISGDDHFFLQFEKRSQDASGARVTTFNPVGLSGGAFVDLGNFASPGMYDAQRPCHGSLAGMLIEHHKKHGAIVAVKIQAILRGIRSTAQRNGQ